MSHQDFFWFKYNCFPSFFSFGWLVTTQKSFILSVFQESSFNLEGFAWLFCHLWKVTRIEKGPPQLGKGKCCTHLQKKMSVMETTVWLASLPSMEKCWSESCWNTFLGTWGRRQSSGAVSMDWPKLDHAWPTWLFSVMTRFADSGRAVDVAYPDSSKVLTSSPTIFLYPTGTLQSGREDNQMGKKLFGWLGWEVMVNGSCAV